MKNFELKINDRTYKVSGFTYRAMRMLSRKWQLKTINAVEKEIERISRNLGKKDLSFDDLDKFGDLLQAVIVIDNPEFEMTNVELMEYAMSDDGFMKQFLAIFNESVEIAAKKKEVENKK